MCWCKSWLRPRPGSVERLGTGETPAWGVLGCDSVLEFAGNIFGKPADAAEAITRWQQWLAVVGCCTLATACWGASSSWPR